MRVFVLICRTGGPGCILICVYPSSSFIDYFTISQVGKIANGQVGAFASLCNNDQVGLLQRPFYLPQTWVDDKDRCNKVGIPKIEQIYRTKPKLAIEILKKLPSEIVYDWVGGDCIYGNLLTLRQYLYSKKTGIYP